jgi:hypothetical protein
MFLAMSFYRRRKFQQCIEICTDLLSKNPYDQVKSPSGAEFALLQYLSADNVTVSTFTCLNCSADLKLML